MNEDGRERAVGGARFDHGRFRECPVIGILRGFGGETTRRVVEAARRGGLRNVEITMDTPGAAESIAALVAEHGDAMNIGAGTVTTVGRLEAAVAAGAGFVVTPCLVRPVLEKARAMGLALFPGALSPTEVITAWEWGATMVKVFPAEGVGLAHVRALRQALPEVDVLPTGGVGLDTVGAFLAAGAGGFGVGGPLFRKDRVEAGDWAWVEARCREWVERVAQFPASDWRGSGGT